MPYNNFGPTESMPLDRAMKNFFVAQNSRLNWFPPIRTDGNNGMQTIFDNRTSGGLVTLYIQNIGTKIAINSDAAADEFHQILAGGTGAKDGTGAQLRLYGFRGRITAFAAVSFSLVTTAGEFAE
jgi:hypothetical protein